MKKYAFILSILLISNAALAQQNIQNPYKYERVTGEIFAYGDLLNVANSRLREEILFTQNLSKSLADEKAKNEAMGKELDELKKTHETK